MDLADMLVQGPDDTIALIVRYGIDKHKAVRPVDGPVDLLLAADVVTLILSTERSSERDQFK